MCSDPVDPGGEVRSCYVGCRIGIWDIAPLVVIVAAGRYTGFLEQKKCFFKRGVVGGGVIFWCCDLHQIVILFTLHWM